LAAQNGICYLGGGAMSDYDSAEAWAFSWHWLGTAVSLTVFIKGEFHV